MGLAFSNISKRFGAVVAISNAEMTVEKGEVRAILGGNGSGKSTLAKIIGGLVEKTQGEITLDGNPINFSSPKDAKNHQVIVTSQELSLFSNLTVEQNICLCNVPKKFGIFTDKIKLHTKAIEILETMNLAYVADK